MCVLLRWGTHCRNVPYRRADKAASSQVGDKYWENRVRTVFEVICYNENIKIAYHMTNEGHFSG